MTEHSAKINRGDIESFAKDFTNPVEYLGETGHSSPDLKRPCAPPSHADLRAGMKP